MLGWRSEASTKFKTKLVSQVRDKIRLCAHGLCTVAARRGAKPLSVKSLRILLACLCLGACNAMPWLEAPVDLPDGSIARVMIRAGGEYRVTVEGANGSASHSLDMSVDDGDRRANLYWTPEHWLVVIDSGGMETFFDLTPGQPPTDDVRERPAAGRSRDWRYLGVVKRTSGDALTFRAPSQEQECIALYGEGSTPYRLQAQHENGC